MCVAVISSSGVPSSLRCGCPDRGQGDCIVQLVAAGGSSAHCGQSSFERFQGPRGRQFCPLGSVRRGAVLRCPVCVFHFLANCPMFSCISFLKIFIRMYVVTFFSNYKSKITEYLETWKKSPFINNLFVGVFMYDSLQSYSSFFSLLIIWEILIIHKIIKKVKSTSNLAHKELFRADRKSVV